MRKIDCVLGVDMGTGGARVGIFDLKGNQLYFVRNISIVYASFRSRRAEAKRMVGFYLQGLKESDGRKRY